MVVLTILSVILAVCVPALISARENSRQARCASNLRQIGIAVEMYRNNHDGYYPPISQVTEEDPGRLRKWFGTATRTFFEWGGDEDSYREDGFLWPYLPARRVLLCPSTANRTDMYRFTHAASGYGYNSLYLGMEYVRPQEAGRRRRTPPAHSVSRPAETVMFADSAVVGRLGQRTRFMETYDVCPPSWGGGPSIHFRHKRKASVMFCDGHVEFLAQRGL